MKRLVQVLVSGVIALGLSQTAYASTFQDLQEKSFTSNGEARQVPSGTSIQSGSSDTTLQGAETLTVYTCPTDKLCRISKVSYNYTGTVTNVRVALLLDNETGDQDGAPTSNEVNAFTGDFWLNEGETVKLTPHGATNGDDLYGTVFGITYNVRD